jgi:AcrR family transcriptional regulator
MSNDAVQNDGDPHTEAGLAPRRTPVQARSIERVERILDAASELLAEGGYDAVKTNLIAKRADVSIGSVYQFFPNRFAIFNALADRYRERISTVLNRHLTPEAGATSWENAIDDTVAALAELWRGERAFHSVWITVQNTPELREASEAYRDALIDDRIAAFLRAIVPDASNDRVTAMGRVVLEASNLLLDLSIHGPDEESDVMIEELQTLLKAYIRTYAAHECQSRMATAMEGTGHDPE